MKIEVVSFTGDSGLADYAVSLARALARSTNATVITSRSLPTRFDNLGFAVERVFRRSRHYPLDILRFFAGVLRRRPDWLLLQGPIKFPIIDALVVRILGIFGIQIAVFVHDVLPHYPSAWSRSEYGFYYRSFKRVIVHSNAALEEIQTLGIKSKILVIPHGVYDIFKLTGITQCEARSSIGIPDFAGFTVLFFGHLEPRKGLLLFIDAARSFKDRSDIKFIMAGSNSLNIHDPVYAAQLDEARLLPNVVVHDWRIAFEDVEKYFEASDLITLPYLEGTTSGVLKLALAFGKPVVASNVGDFPEQVPLGAGVIININGKASQSLCEAIEIIKGSHKRFATGMSLAGQDAQWPDIADRLIAYLKSK